MAAILTVTAIIYSRSLRNEFVLDDWEQIVNNHRLADWSFVWKSMVRDVIWFRDPLHLPQSPYYRPVHDLWLWINFHLFGPHPLGWHAAALALHLVIVWLVFRVAALLTMNRRTALLAAALFALMPIHAEAVAWPAAIAPMLAAAFELGAFMLYLRDPGAHRATPLALFGGALLSYESAVVFPVLVFVHAFLLQTHETYKSYRTYARARSAIAAAWPYALEAAAYLALRLWVLGFIQPPSGSHLARGMTLTALQFALAIPDSIATCALLLLMPWRAAPAHRLLMDVSGSIASPGFYLPAAGLAALFGAGCLIFRHHPHRLLYLFCTAWILIALSPMFHETGIFIQDRYLYLPSFGFCAMAADLAMAFAQSNARRAKAVAIGAGVVTIGYAAALFQVQAYWHDDAAFYSQCVREVPKMEPWHYQLGIALAKRGNFADARREFQIAADLMRDLLRRNPGNADAQAALAAAVAADRRYDKASAAHRGGAAN